MYGLSRKWKSSLALWLAVLILLTSAVPAYAASTEDSGASQDAGVIAGEYIVKYESSSAPAAQTPTYGIAGIEEVQSDPEALVSLVTVDPQRDADEVVSELESLPGVEFAEPNRIYEVFDAETSGIFAVAAPSDPYYTSQWALNAIAAPQAWERLQNNTNSVVVAVVDTGIDATHPDLQGRLLPGVNMADARADGTSYESDWGSKDDQGHGTAVASVIASVYNNTIGIAGAVGPLNVSVLPVKVMNNKGWGTTLNVAKGITYAADQGVDIINLSLGGEYSKAIVDAVSYAQSKNVLVVAAAGNEGTNVNSTYPAAAPGVLAVGSIGKTKLRSSFSNYGSSLAVVAPGEDILVAALSGQGNVDDRYSSVNGTSFSSPYAAAVAAIYKADHPSALPGEIRSALMDTAQDLGTAGVDPYFGHGLVNAAAVLDAGTVAPIQIIRPASGADVTGTATLEAMVNQDANEVTAVRFYLDEIAPANQIAEAVGTAGQSLYTAKWDSSGAADGNRSLLAVAYKGSAPAFQTELRVKLWNNPETGLVLKVKDPDGNVAPGALVMVSKQVAATAAAEEAAAAVVPTGQPAYSYEMVWNGYTDVEGVVRIPGALAVDLKKLSVLVQGSFDQADNPQGNTSFFYQRIVQGPGVFELDGEGTAGVHFQTTTRSGAPAKASNYYATLLDNNGVSYGTTTALNDISITTEPTIYMDKGVYNLFSYGKEQDGTYFLSKWHNQVTTATTDMSFDGQQTGEVAIGADEQIAGGVIYLYNEQTDEALGVSTTLNSTGSDQQEVISGEKVYVTAGDYRYWVDLEIKDPSGGQNWVYVLGSNQNRAKVTAGGQTTINAGGGLRLAKFEPDLDSLKNYFDKIGEIYEPQLPYYFEKRGKVVYTKHEFLDNFDNQLVGMYRGSVVHSTELFKKSVAGDDLGTVTADESGKWETQSYYFGDLYPVYKVVNEAGNYVPYNTGALSPRPAFRLFYWSGLWAINASKVTPGTYYVTLSLQNNPLAGRELSSTMENHIIDNQGVELSFKDEKGQAIRPFTWIYHLDKDEHGNAEWVKSFQLWADSTTKKLYVTGGIKLSEQENGNMAVIRYTNSAGQYVYVMRQFTKVSDLIDPATGVVQVDPGLQAVDLTTKDKDGNALQYLTKKLHEVIVPAAVNGKETNFLFPLETTGRIYLEPKDYRFDAHYITTADGQGRKSNYYFLTDQAVAIGGVAGVQTVAFDANTDKMSRIETVADKEGYNDFRGVALYPFSTYSNTMYETYRAGQIFYVPAGVDYHLEANLVLGDMETPSYAWNYMLEHREQTFEAGQNTIWHMGGTFSPSLALHETQFTAGSAQTLEGDTSVVDSYGNVIEAILVTDSTNVSALSTDADGLDGVAYTRLASGEVKAGTANLPSAGELEASHADDATIAKSIYPRLRIYSSEQSGGSEKLVTDWEKFGYYSSFKEAVDLPVGSYRAELALAAGPLGPTTTLAGQGNFQVTAAEVPSTPTPTPTPVATPAPTEQPTPTPVVDPEPTPSSSTGNGSSGTGNSGSDSSGGTGTGSTGAAADGRATDAEIASAISAAAGKEAITLNASKDALTLSVEQWKKLGDSAKPIQFVMGDARIQMPAGAIPASILAAQSASSTIKWTATPINEQRAAALLKQAANASLVSLSGSIYDFGIVVTNASGVQVRVTAFDEPVTLSLKVSQDSVTAAKQGELGGYHYDESNARWNYMGGTYDAATGHFKFETTHFSMYALMKAKEPFVQISELSDIKGHWAEQAITTLAQQGYVKGVGDGKFAPNRSVTRAEWVTMLALAFFDPASSVSDAPGTQSAHSFSDVAESHWAGASIQAAVEAGLLNGYEDGTFRPNRAITREEMAVMLSRFAAWKSLNVAAEASADSQAVADAFADSGAVADWAKSSINTAIQLGLMKGRSNTQFAPKGELTRAEGATIVVRLLDMLKSK
ncbi:hypothetical protein BBD42_02570 [Paenibacillus sp. BIHB 4019]|uniref:SLH domain-containing protein n=1 Tax=Paenibacillus sp. BIHB 4019 TaxID=1870819 RepID=A0A1B2DCN3_9BACL|nr:S8 family serine peptidase [Paenibacillus sp. BIHB 4019]ANY65471.1 hypothetical protein BBD42_02570 [Paenibacillus sp. BIHB 4019]